MIIQDGEEAYFDQVEQSADIDQKQSEYTGIQDY